MGDLAGSFVFVQTGNPRLQIYSNGALLPGSSACRISLNGSGP
jgi:hypothetical protein